MENKTVAIVQIELWSETELQPDMETTLRQVEIPEERKRFFLLGAGYLATRKALEEAGFKLATTQLEALDAQWEVLQDERDRYEWEARQDERDS